LGGIVGATEPADLDDAAGGRRLGECLDPAEAHMVGAAVGAIDDRVGFSGQLVVQPGCDEAPDDRRRRGASVNHVVSDAAVLAALGEGAVHGLDDVAAHAEITQGRLGLQADDPLGRPGGRRKAHAFQPLQPADGEAAHLWVIHARIVRPQIDEAHVVRGHSDRVVEAGPALRVHLPCEGRTDFVFGLGAKFDRHQVLGPRAQTVADVVAGDDEIGAVLCDATHQQMNVRIVGIPMRAMPIQSSRVRRSLSI
jgi:hypothetical protein